MAGWQRCKGNSHDCFPGRKDGLHPQQPGKGRTGGKPWRILVQFGPWLCGRKRAGWHWTGMTKTFALMGLQIPGHKVRIANPDQPPWTALVQIRRSRFVCSNYPVLALAVTRGQLAVVCNDNKQMYCIEKHFLISFNQKCLPITILSLINMPFTF